MTGSITMIAKPFENIKYDTLINFIHGNCKGRSELCSLLSMGSFTPEKSRKLNLGPDQDPNLALFTPEAHKHQILSLCRVVHFIRIGIMLRGREKHGFI